MPTESYLNDLSPEQLEQDFGISRTTRCVITDFDKTDFARGEAVFQRFEEAVNSDHYDFISLNRANACLLRDYVNTLRQECLKTRKIA